MWVKGIGNLGVVRSDKLAARHGVSRDTARALKLKYPVDLTEAQAKLAINAGIACTCTVDEMKAAKVAIKAKAEPVTESEDHDDVRS